MTIQVVSALGGALMLLAIIVILVLMVAAAVQVCRRRKQSALRVVGVLVGMVLLYGAVVLGFGLASSPEQLKPGDTKCFDDWCASMIAARPDAATGRLLIDVRLENRGRGRVMRSDLARAYVEVPGRGSVVPRDGHMLQTLLRPAEPLDVELAFDVSPRIPGMRFVVSEGSETIGPGTFTIGDEGSPFHARAGWPLAAS